MLTTPTQRPSLKYLVESSSIIMKKGLAGVKAQGGHFGMIEMAARHSNKTSPVPMTMIP